MEILVQRIPVVRCEDVGHDELAVVNNDVPLLTYSTHCTRVDGRAHQCNAVFPAILVKHRADDGHRIFRISEVNRCVWALNPPLVLARAVNPVCAVPCLCVQVKLVFHLRAQGQVRSVIVTGLRCFNEAERIRPLPVINAVIIHQNRLRLNGRRQSNVQVAAHRIGLAFKRIRVVEANFRAIVNARVINLPCKVGRAVRPDHGVPFRQIRNNRSKPVAQAVNRHAFERRRNVAYNRDVGTRLT